MKIYINDEQFDATIYDDSSSILMRYSLTQDETLPEYLRIENEDYHLQSGLRLSVWNIQTELKDIELEDLADSLVMKEILFKYPQLDKMSVSLLWLLNRYSTVLNQADLPVIIGEHINSLRKIDLHSFSNASETAQQLRKYSKRVTERRGEIGEIIDRQKSIIQNLDGIKPVKSGEFNLEEVTVLLSLDLPTGTSLTDVFDAMDVSRDIPFIHLRIQGNDLYKIYSHIIPPDAWIIDEQIEDGIYFKILSAPYSRLTSRRRFETLYSNGIWGSRNNVEIAFNIDVEIGENAIKEKFFDSIKTNLLYKISQERYLSVKGKFTVENVVFNKAIFADMISNSKVMGYFLFFNERSQDFKSYRSAITKKRFGFYYHPNQNYDISRSLTIIVTPYISEDNIPMIDVRVTRAMNSQQANSFRNVFSRLLGVYEKNHDKVIRIYKDLLPSAGKKMETEYMQKPKKRVKIDRKSGRRLRSLKNKRPGVFRSEYASMCQPIMKQPYIIDSKEDAERIKREYGEHKVMEFTDPTTGKEDWYACEPREKEDDDKRHIWPGLRLNTKGKSGYKEQVPYLPCCFTEDQYTKPAALLRKRILEREGETRDITEEAQIGDVGHILASNKPAPTGRFGQVPYYLNFIVRNAGYQEIEKGKQMFLPVLRYGLMDSPDSFLHCLEKALNPRYSSLDKGGKIESVRNVRKELSEMNFAVARQELYDYTDEEIQKMLLEENTYLDPGMWVRLAEVKYNINIFIYQVDDDHPNGAIVIPRFSQAYLLRDISETTKSVFIVKNSNLGDWPYQCELLILYQPTAKRSKRFVYAFKNSPLVGQAIKSLYEANEVSVVTPKGSIFYAPVNIS